MIREPFRTMVLLAGCLGLRVSDIVGLKWCDFRFRQLSLLVQRSRVHGKDGDVKTECKGIVFRLTRTCPSLSGAPYPWFEAPDGWLFANPVTAMSHHQEGIQKRQIREAGIAAGIGGDIGWHTFRHSYRSWLDEAGATMTVQKELMRHASIQSTMNVYGKAMSYTKRQALREQTPWKHPVLSNVPVKNVGGGPLSLLDLE
jgi:integrase